MAKNLTIDEKVDMLLKQVAILLKANEGVKRSDGNWVKAADLAKYTEWNDYSKYRKARQMNWVRYRKMDTGGYEYDMASINERHLLKQLV